MNGQYRYRQVRYRRSGNKPYSDMNENELHGLPLAMAYVPLQEWKDIYDRNKALSSGTVFAQLDLPFGGSR